MFSSNVNVFNKLKSWKTKPISRRRNFAKSFFPNLCGFFPLIKIFPVVGSSIVAIMFIFVVFLLSESLMIPNKLSLLIDKFIFVTDRLGMYITLNILYI